MTHRSLVMLAVFALAALPACKDRGDKAGSTTTTGAGIGNRPATVEDVRMVMLVERPDQTTAINALQITNVDGTVTLRGHVDDEQAKKALVERVKRMPNVKDVKDELVVLPPSKKIERAPMMDEPGAPAEP
ncbi:MAG: BON domain-containing protein [Polyangiales bacterium]